MLKDVSFSLQRHQRIAIAGETGSGKSTLLKIIAGLMQPDTGEVQLNDERVLGPAEKLVPGHPDIAYLSQHFELPQFLRVEQALDYANALSNDDASTLFDVCRIGHLLKRRTDQLSGGERQRVAIARLLITSPSLLLLDEPFSNLDVAHKQLLKTVIEDIGASLNITCILVSHDPADTLSWADHILVIKAGRVVQQGSPAQVYRQPVDAYTAGLFGKYNLVDPASSRHIFELAGIKANGKSMLIRPEHFKIARQGTNTLTGTVSQVSFFGGYYEVEVALSHGNITLRKTAGDIAPKGETVHITFDPADVWLVDT